MNCVGCISTCKRECSSHHFHWWDWCHCHSSIRCSDWGWSGGATYSDGAFEPGTPTYIHIAHVYVQVKLARCKYPPLSSVWHLTVQPCGDLTVLLQSFPCFHLLSFAVIQVQKSIISTQCQKVCQWLVLILSGKRSEFQTWHPTAEHELKNMWSFMFFLQNIENHVAWFHAEPCKVKKVCKKTREICAGQSSIGGI